MAFLGADFSECGHSIWRRHEVSLSITLYSQPCLNVITAILLIIYCLNFRLPLSVLTRILNIHGEITKIERFFLSFKN